MVLKTKVSKRKDLDGIRKMKTALNSSYYLTYVVDTDRHGALWSKEALDRSTMLAHSTAVKRCFPHPSTELLIADTGKAVSLVKIRLET